MFGFKKKLTNDIERSLNTEVERLKELVVAKKADNPTIVKGMYIDFGLGAFDMFGKELQLDFTPESIKRVEARLATMHDSMASAQPAEDVIDRFVKLFGGYVGCVLMQTGWEWSLDGDNPLDPSKVVVARNGKQFYVISKVYKRLLNGPEDNVWDAYYIIDTNE